MDRPKQSNGNKEKQRKKEESVWIKIKNIWIQSKHVNVKKKPLRFVDLVVEKLQELVDLCVLIFVGSCKPTGLEFSAWRWRRTLKYISNKRTRNNNNSVQEILFESQPFLKRRIDDHFWRFRGVLYVLETKIMWTLSYHLDFWFFSYNSIFLPIRTLF